MPGAVDRDRILHAGRICHLLGHFRPVCPAGTFAQQLNASLIKQGLVDVRAGHTQTIRETTIPHRFQDRFREVGFVVSCVIQIWAQIQGLAAVSAKVGDAGQVGSFTGLYLYWQLFVDGCIGDNIQHDGDGRIICHEVIQNCLHHICFNSVCVKGETQFNRLCRCFFSSSARCFGNGIINILLETC